MQKKNEVVYIYTDGACSGNPGPGGWAALLVYNGKEKELAGREQQTTNNRMELTAAIRAFQALKRTSIVKLYTDSNYVKDGVSKWLPQWKERGWRTADKKPVKNVDLWQELEKAVEKHRIEWHWVKAHNGHVENERVDTLARQQIDKTLL